MASVAAASSSLRGASLLALLSIVAVDVGMLAADEMVGMAGATRLLSIGRLALLVAGLFTVQATVHNSLMVGTVFVALTVQTAGAVFLGHARGQPETVLIVTVTLCLGSAAMIPWGRRMQAWMAAAQFTIVMLSALVFQRTFPAPILAVYTAGALVLSVYLASQVDASRAELEARTLEDEQARLDAEELSANLEATVRERTVTLEVTGGEFEQLCQAMSHDLRPPLRTLGGFSEILRETAVREQRPATARILDDVVTLATEMADRVDRMLREARIVHRRIIDDLVSMSEVASSECEILADRSPECRWFIHRGALVGSAPRALDAMLRSLLRYVVTSAAGTLREVEVGRRVAGSSEVYFVRAAGWPADAADLSCMSDALAGTLSFGQVPAGMEEVVIAARSLVTVHRGQVWVDGDGEAELTFSFCGRGRDATAHGERL